MFSTILNEVTGIIDRRFLMNVFFPSLVFWGLLIVIWFAGKGTLVEAAKAWNQQETTLLAIEIIGFIAWALIFAYVLDNQMMAILKLYEGYWDFPGGGFFRKLGTLRHRQRLEALGQAVASDDVSVSNPSYQEIYMSYPLPTQVKEVMPTRLGNILKNSELYPRSRYGIDAVVIWPRLYGLFPEGYIGLIGQARAALDFMLVISSLSAALAILGGVYLLVVKAQWWLFLACFWGGMLVACLGYRGAVGSALLYGQQIKVGFDLYRNELLKQMRVPLRRTVVGEKEVWNELVQFLLRNVRPRAFNYLPAETAVADKKEKK